ncbi:MAG: NAD(P)-dependent oxidoreductase [Candidatus Nanoarchaeia archaeon]
MKVLVTGGAGYIGCVLVKELLDRGYSVRIFDKFYFGKEPLKHVAKKVECIQGDLKNFDPAILDGIGGVIHLGGFSNDPMAEFNPKFNDEVNAEATKILAEACIKKGVYRFVYASSASIYDKGLKGSDKEQTEEENEVEPKSAYSASKYKGELFLLELMQKEPRFCPVILRQGTVFGYSPRMRYDLVVNTFVKDAIKKGKLTVFCGGSAWRPLVSVNDLVKAQILAMEAKEELVRGQLFNVSLGNYQIWDIAHRVREVFKKIKPIEVDIDYSPERMDRSYKISNKKMENLLGMRYTVSIEDAVREMIEKISNGAFNDFDNPQYYNIKWIEFLKEMEDKLKEMGGVF